MSEDMYLSTVQVVTLYGISLMCVLQSPLGSSLSCSVKYLSGEEPEPPVTQWRWRRRDSTPSWGTDNFLGGWGRSVDVTRMAKGEKWVGRKARRRRKSREKVMGAGIALYTDALGSHFHNQVTLPHPHTIMCALKLLDVHIWYLSPLTAANYTSASASAVWKHIKSSGLSIDNNFCLSIVACMCRYTFISLYT